MRDKMFDQKMNRFIEQVDYIVKKEEDEVLITTEVAKVMKELLANNYTLPKKFTVPNKEKYVLFPLFVSADEAFSIASAVWDVGQTTPIHDHGTWGVIGIVQGTEYEERFKKP